MDDALIIGVRSEQDHAIVTVAGKIDMSTVTRLRDRLFELASSGRRLVIDLGQVSFISAAGIGALVGTAKHAATYGGSLSLVGAPPKIRRLFHLAGLDHQIPLAPTLDEALAEPRTTTSLANRRTPT
jgi:anti-anti-sigma factor